MIDGLQAVPDALGADGAVGSQVLGPERHAVFLEHPWQIGVFSRRRCCIQPLYLAGTRKIPLALGRQLFQSVLQPGHIAGNVLGTIDSLGSKAPVEYQ